MVRSVEMGGGDLEAFTHRKVEPLPKMKSSYDESWSHVHLRLPVILAVLKKGVIHFDFRPELPKDPVLECIIPDEASPDRFGVAHRHCDAECPLHIEIPESFSVGDCRHDDWV